MSTISRSSSLTSRTAPSTRWESKEWARLVLSELRPPSPTLSITLPESACVTFQLQSTRYSGDYLTLLALSGYSDCAPKCSLLAQSGHHGRADQCPLSGVKRTSSRHTAMSAFDPLDAVPCC